MKQFALCDEPILYQLTIHFNNYEEYYGEGTFKDDYYSYRTYGDVPKNHPLYNSYNIISNLINYYGIMYIEEFINTFCKIVA